MKKKNNLELEYIYFFNPMYLTTCSKTQQEIFKCYLLTIFPKIISMLFRLRELNKKSYLLETSYLYKTLVKKI